MYFRHPRWLPLIAVALIAHYDAESYAESAHDGNGQLGFRYDNFRSVERLVLVGSARSDGSLLRLTPAKHQRTGGVWFQHTQPVAAGFDTEFTFRFTKQAGLGPGADGIAFVIQNRSTAELAGRGASGGFAPGDGFRQPSSPGIPESVAVFFDTYRNEEDPSDNYIVLCTNGKLGQMNWPPTRLGISGRLPVRMKDGNVHSVRIRYVRPMLSVYLDRFEDAVLRAPVDLTTITGAEGYAWVGFTAATGGGYENHDLLKWSYTGEQIESGLFDVSSRISYNLTDCMEGRNLCTPAKPVAEERKAGEWQIILPAHLRWAASIPNPLGRPVRIIDPAGTVCFGSHGLAECVDGGGAVIQRNDSGRTWFSVAGTRENAETGQGFVEFRAVLQVDTPSRRRTAWGVSAASALTPHPSGV